MIPDTHIVDWYKLVSVSWFDWDIKEIEPYTCYDWFVFLVPEDLDIGAIKTKKFSLKELKNLPGHFEGGWQFTTSWFWESFFWALENEDTKLVWKMMGEYSFYKDKPKFSHLLELNRLELMEDWEYWLNDYFSIWFNYKWIFYAIWWIILICWVVYYIKRKKRNTWDEVE